MKDLFRPTQEPARSIYDAFQKEASKRKECFDLEWILLERVAIFREAWKQAKKFGYALPSINLVKEAEKYASGHADYGAKLAYRLVEIMKEKTSHNV